MTIPPRPRIEVEDVRSLPVPTVPVPNLTPLRPRMELEDAQAERLDAEPPLEALADPAPSRRAPLFLAGAATLALGVGGLSLANLPLTTKWSATELSPMRSPMAKPPAGFTRCDCSSAMTLAAVAVTQ